MNRKEEVDMEDDQPAFIAGEAEILVRDGKF